VRWTNHAVSARLPPVASRLIVRTIMPRAATAETPFTPTAEELERTDRVKHAAQLASRAPVPARLGRVLAGTAGWTDPSLIKSQSFYPKGSSSPADRLRFYSSQFPLVEVDATYYALPSPMNARLWAERTPPDFTFNIKAFAPLTQHPVEVARLPSDLQLALPEETRSKARVYPKDLPEEIRAAIWDRFKRAIDPLREAHKLGCVLLQFPPWFTATRGNARLIEETRAKLSDVPVAVELRHASWGEPERLGRVIALLGAIGASYVVVDEPQGKANSMPPAVKVADPSLAVMRFHGRRAETWDARVSVKEKFDYLYSPAELEPWALAAQRLADEAEAVHVIFNNCVANYAVLGAKGLMALLAAAPAAAPAA
jgi:uncharacterized protein YecE (DUF72 family)